MSSFETTAGAVAALPRVPQKIFLTKAYGSTPLPTFYPAYTRKHVRFDVSETGSMSTSVAYPLTVLASMARAFVVLAMALLGGAGAAKLWFAVKDRYRRRNDAARSDELLGELEEGERIGRGHVLVEMQPRRRSMSVRSPVSESQQDLLDDALHERYNLATLHHPSTSQEHLSTSTEDDVVNVVLADAHNHRSSRISLGAPLRVDPSPPLTLDGLNPWEDLVGLDFVPTPAPERTEDGAMGADVADGMSRQHMEPLIHLSPASEVPEEAKFPTFDDEEPGYSFMQLPEQSDIIEPSSGERSAATTTSMDWILDISPLRSTTPSLTSAQSRLVEVAPNHDPSASLLILSPELPARMITEDGQDADHDLAIDTSDITLADESDEDAALDSAALTDIKHFINSSLGTPVIVPPTPTVESLDALVVAVDEVGEFPDPTLASDLDAQARYSPAVLDDSADSLKHVVEEGSRQTIEMIPSVRSSLSDRAPEFRKDQEDVLPPADDVAVLAEISESSNSPLLLENDDNARPAVDMCFETVWSMALQQVAIQSPTALDATDGVPVPIEPWQVNNMAAEKETVIPPPLLLVQEPLDAMIEGEPEGTFVSSQVVETPELTQQPPETAEGQGEDDAGRHLPILTLEPLQIIDTEDEPRKTAFDANGTEQTGSPVQEDPTDPPLSDLNINNIKHTDSPVKEDTTDPPLPDLDFAKEPELQTTVVRSTPSLRMRRASTLLDLALAVPILGPGADGAALVQLMLAVYGWVGFVFLQGASQMRQPRHNSQGGVS